MAIRTITWEVQEDGMSLSPATCQDGGVQGDHNKTRAEFVLPSSLIDGYDFYIECVDVLGEWDTTEKLEVENNRVVTLLPLAWTQHGGEATLRLVAAKEGEVGYTLEGRVRYHSRAGLLEKVKALVDGCIQAMLTRMEAAAEVIENAGDAKEIASQALEESQEALERVHGTNRIYVGSGEMPEDCNVKIDPEGNVFTPDDFVPSRLITERFSVGDEYDTTETANEAVEVIIEDVFSRMEISSSKYIEIVVNSKFSTLPPGANILFVYKAGHGNYGLVKTISHLGGELRKRKEAGKWLAWEWYDVNSAIGIERLTTELFCGNPVYVKWIYVGALGEKAGQEYGYDSGIDETIFPFCIDGVVTSSNGYTTVHRNLAGFVSSLEYNRDTKRIFITPSVNSNGTTYKAYVRMKYTKRSWL